MVSISIYGEPEEVARFFQEMGYRDIIGNGEKLEDDCAAKEKEGEESDLSGWRSSTINPMKDYNTK